MGFLKPMTEKKPNGYGVLNHEHTSHNKTLIIHTKSKSSFAFRGFANSRCHSNIKLKNSLDFSGHSRRFLVAFCRNGVAGDKKEAAPPHKVSANKRIPDQRKCKSSKITLKMCKTQIKMLPSFHYFLVKQLKRI